MYRPDFRTINDFRKDNTEYFKKCFVDVVKVCQQLGMVKVGTIAFDSTKIRANGAAKNTHDKAGYRKWLLQLDQQIQTIINKAEEINSSEDDEHGNFRGDELPHEIRQKQQLRLKIQQVLEHIREEETINLTDPDARIMKDKTTFTSCYNCQAATTLDGIIVSAFVTTSAGDKKQLLPLIDQAQQNTNETINNVLADSGYSSYEVYEKLKEQNITAYIPDQLSNLQEKRKENLFDRSRFHYNEQNDSYTCPQGKELHFHEMYFNKKQQQKARIYTTSECLACPMKSQCTKGNRRYINRELREPLREQVRELLNSPHGKALYRKRMQTIEPIWGNLKENKKVRQFNLRGKEKVNAEFLLHCLSHNINKIYKNKIAA
jgi:transposase